MGDFLNRTPMTQALWSIINKQDLIKLKIFWKSKDMIIRTKQPPADWGKISINSTLNPKYIKNSRS